MNIKVVVRWGHVYFVMFSNKHVFKIQQKINSTFRKFSSRTSTVFTNAMQVLLHINLFCEENNNATAAST